MNAIETNLLTKTYPGKVALDHLSLEVETHKIHGLLGPNGAGKTTMMSILSCLVRQSSGEARVLGYNTLKESSLIKEKIGFLPETTPLYEDMTVEDFLVFKGGLYGIGQKESLKKSSELLERLVLKEIKDSPIEILSKGYKQRVSIAATLIHGPEVLILDEPASGLDPKAIKDVRNLITDLKNDHTILLSSHQLGEVAKVCDQISIINSGKLLLSGSMNEVLKKFNSTRVIELQVKSHSQMDYPELFKDMGQVEIEKEREGLQYLRVQTHEDRDYRAEICKRLVDHQVDVYELAQKEMALEDVFIEAIKN